ncbi:MAG TPA: ABC transporter permease subunit [Paenalcaligenes hominis]|uniref:ABC transporter permease subunit n=1 Tax=Paenalcaligenes hominis TaxID=643674 RepID=A0A9D3AB52_9BURK|nr:ABC transporter permease subunit [Paenalcaligenes hominis]NJB65491.1 octopine/nopaline transport system permease protein [Paenalcaligenes hominis]GGE65433.1 ABC transporter permease [Paenalcaligenes hominis]HJH23839.1 ABC transporter permease subunit [Paenalcaligenes hominis]
MMSWDEFSHTVSVLWKGFGLTLYIGLWGIGLSLLVGVTLALMRLSPNRLFSNFAFVYSTIFRGTPLLVQLFLLYYGVGMIGWVKHVPWLWWLFSDGTRTAILAIALNSGAYVGEVFRGGFQSVPKGQIEAAQAIGMSAWQCFKRVRLPLAIRQALPAYSNEIVICIKGTSLASTIAVLELTGYARRIMSQNYAIVETFVIAGLLYLAINFSLLAIVHVVERQLMHKRG